MREKRSNVKLTNGDFVRPVLDFTVTFLFITGIVMLSLFLYNVDTYRAVIVEQPLKFGASVAVIAASLFLLYIELIATDPQVLKTRKIIVMLLSLILLCFLADVLFGLLVSHYMRPYALIVLLVGVLLNKNTGFYSSMTVLISIIVFDFIASGYSMSAIDVIRALVIGFTSCSIAAYVASDDTKRIKVFNTGIVIGLSACLIVFLFEVIEGSFGNGDAAGFNIILALVGEIIAAALYLAFLPIYERMFNVLTVFRLNELTDHNNPLIKMMMAKAPGTFNHVLIVSNLAEACALAIGEDAHLTRAAAYYHDIGKLVNPQYFTENQNGENPHDQLTPELSTSFIKKHTEDGFRLAKKYNLPEEIADITREHHGTMPIKYFYYKATKFTDGNLSIANFCYPGPKPKSKIAAIIMIADAAEAAVRSMKNRDRVNVEKTVRNIIEERMDLDQFSECDLSLREMYMIRDTIVASFSGFYHDRIAYPKIKIAREEMASSGEDGSSNQ